MSSISNRKDFKILDKVSNIISNDVYFAINNKSYVVGFFKKNPSSLHFNDLELFAYGVMISRLRVLIKNINTHIKEFEKQNYPLNRKSSFQIIRLNIQNHVKLFLKKSFDAEYPDKIIDEPFVLLIMWSMFDPKTKSDFV